MKPACMLSLLENWRMCTDMKQLLILSTPKYRYHVTLSWIQTRSPDLSYELSTFRHLLHSLRCHLTMQDASSSMTTPTRHCNRTSPGCKCTTDRPLAFNSRSNIIYSSVFCRKMYDLAMRPQHMECVWITCSIDWRATVSTKECKDLRLTGARCFQSSLILSMVQSSSSM